MAVLGGGVNDYFSSPDGVGYRHSVGRPVGIDGAEHAIMSAGQDVPRLGIGSLTVVAAHCVMGHGGLLFFADSSCPLFSLSECSGVCAILLRLRLFVLLLASWRILPGRCGGRQFRFFLGGAGGRHGKLRVALGQDLGAHRRQPRTVRRVAGHLPSR